MTVKIKHNKAHVLYKALGYNHCIMASDTGNNHLVVSTTEVAIITMGKYDHELSMCTRYSNRKRWRKRLTKTTKKFIHFVFKFGQSTTLSRLRSIYIHSVILYGFL